MHYIKYIMKSKKEKELLERELAAPGIMQFGLIAFIINN